MRRIYLHFYKKIFKRLPNEHWRVQAFLPSSTTGSFEYRYQPTFFSRRSDAIKQLRQLRQSFTAGMAEFEFKREPK